MVIAGGEGTCCVVTRVTRVDHAFRLEVAAGRLSAIVAIGIASPVGLQHVAYLPSSYAPSQRSRNSEKLTLKRLKTLNIA